MTVHWRYEPPLCWFLRTQSNQNEWPVLWGYIAHQGVTITFNQAMSFSWAPLGLLAPFSKVQAFLADQVIWSVASAFGLGSLWNIFVRAVVPVTCAISPVGGLQHGQSTPIRGQSAFANQTPSPPKKKPKKAGSKSTLSCHHIKLIFIRLIQSHTTIFTDGVEEF